MANHATGKTMWRKNAVTLASTLVTDSKLTFGFARSVSPQTGVCAIPSCKYGAVVFSLGKNLPVCLPLPSSFCRQPAVPSEVLCVIKQK